MTKAELQLPNGTKVKIEGTLEDIKALMESYSSDTPRTGRKHRKNGSKQNASSNNKNKKKKSRKIGPNGLIRELLEEGYFKSQKRSLSDIQKKLEERGHIYAQTSLSPALTRLTRSRDLRRIGEKKGWVYVV
jgi:hypothetical protein